MGTVLSFSPRERRPVYSTHHHSHHHHNHHHHSSNSSSSSSCRGRTSIGGGGIGIGEGGRRTSGGDVGSVHSSCSISSSNSADFQLNNYSYEQLNNVKNRENSKPTVNNNNNLNNNINNNLSSTNNTTNTTNLDRTNNNDTARILSEKNALEKNLKKHSLFINALSWKRLASSHGKKKLESNQKNKAANLPTATFRPPLADAIHPLVVDKNKNIQQQTHQIQIQQHGLSGQQQIQQQQQHQQQQQQQQPQQVVYGYNTPVTQKNALLALDLVRANNTNSLQQPTDKLSTKLPLSLPLSIPIQNNNNNTINNHTQIVQHQRQHQPQLQHNHHNRKTVIQVCGLFFIYFFFNESNGFWFDFMGF